MSAGFSSSPAVKTVSGDLESSNSEAPRQRNERRVAKKVFWSFWSYGLALDTTIFDLEEVVKQKTLMIHVLPARFRTAGAESFRSEMLSIAVLKKIQASRIRSRLLPATAGPGGDMSWRLIATELRSAAILGRDE